MHLYTRTFPRANVCPGHCGISEVAPTKAAVKDRSINAAREASIGLLARLFLPVGLFLPVTFNGVTNTGGNEKCPSMANSM